MRHGNTQNGDVYYRLYKHHFISLAMLNSAKQLDVNHLPLKHEVRLNII
jgi:hypothetical protein